MINYIIQVILFQVLFLAVYDLFLSKETFFTKNRWYLLVTSIVSFLIPIIKISTFQKVIPKEYTVLLPEVMLSPQSVIENTSLYQSLNYIELFFGLGSLIFLLFFFMKLGKIFMLIYNNKVEKKSNYKLVWLSNQTKAFSFFKFIFLGKNIAESKQEKIIQHELVHSEQNHSLDLLFFEFLKIFMWFNPMVWMYQSRISLVHEYISDAVVTKETTKENYINNILSDLFQVENISFINQFYKHSLIKKRIIMMTKEKSKQIKQLKYLLLVPVLASMLFYTSCSDDQASEEVVAKKELTTIYLNFGNDNEEEMTGKDETYMDFYQGKQKPNWEEITYNDLTKEEREEYKNSEKKIKDLNSSYNQMYEVKLYKKPKGRKVIVHIIDFSKMKRKTETEYIEGEDVPFSILDQSPTYPGCTEGDKDCFNRKMNEFIRTHFNKDLANNLGLSKGKKRIYIQFKIEKEGAISNINVRAPHPVLKEEAIKMMSKLPKLRPGLKDGEIVRVGYTLPIAFMVE